MKFPHLKPAGEAKYHDQFVVKANEILRPWKGEDVEGFSLIGVPLSKSSISHSGASFAPEAIRIALSYFTTYAIEEEKDVQTIRVTDLGDIRMHPTDILLSQRRIEEMVRQLTAAYRQMIPIFLGGDHSISASTIKGFAGGRGKVGVIQFDAHHDLRNVEDGGPTNGTPFRRLIESGTIEGKHLVQIGIRNFANSRPYREYAEEKGVAFYTMKEVRSRPIRVLLDEAIRKISEEVDAIYLSLDMDVLDQAFAPGCPAIGPGGMDMGTLIEAVSYLGKVKKVQAVDLVEVDPTKDVRDMTSRAAAYLLLTFLASKMAD